MQVQQFAQQSLASALGASGPFGDKVQEHGGLPGNLRNLRECLMLLGNDEVGRATRVGA